LKTRWQR